MVKGLRRNTKEYPSHRSIARFRCPPPHRKASMKHLVLAAKCGTFASSKPITLDAAKRLWNVALPLADTAAGRAMTFSPLRGVIKEMVKGGVVDGGSVRSQVKGVIRGREGISHVVLFTMQGFSADVHRSVLKVVPRVLHNEKVATECEYHRYRNRITRRYVL